ncbi:hypothetical protein WDZ92_15445 [Nostoc sp. NIES-2111]
MSRRPWIAASRLHQTVEKDCSILVQQPGSAAADRDQPEGDGLSDRGRRRALPAHGTMPAWTA